MSYHVLKSLALAVLALHSFVSFANMHTVSCPQFISLSQSDVDAISYQDVYAPLPDSLLEEGFMIPQVEMSIGGLVAGVYQLDHQEIAPAIWPPSFKPSVVIRESFLNPGYVSEIVCSYVLNANDYVYNLSVIRPFYDEMVSIDKDLILTPHFGDTGIIGGQFSDFWYRFFYCNAYHPGELPQFDASLCEISWVASDGE